MPGKSRFTLIAVLILITAPVLLILFGPDLTGFSLNEYDRRHFQKERYLFRKTHLYIRKNGRFISTARTADRGYYTTDLRVVRTRLPNFLRLQNKPDYWIHEAYTSAASRLGRKTTLPVGGERVDRWYSVGPEYRPGDLVRLTWEYCRIRRVSLRKEAAEAFRRLVRAARREGIRLYAFSGFRPFAVQRALYLRRITIGRKLKQRAVARPGHSEHQLGTTVDVVGVRTDLAATHAFGKTREAAWLRKRCHDFGFVLSYGPDNRIPTGYITETWHIRYIGLSRIDAWKKRHLR